MYKKNFLGQLNIALLIYLNINSLFSVNILI